MLKPVSLIVRGLNILRRIANRMFFAVWVSVVSTPVIFYTRAYAYRWTSEKKRLLIGAVSVVVLLAGLAFNFSAYQPARAAVSDNLNFQARLEKANGAIANDGNYNIRFRLYNASTGGSALWTESYLNSASQGVRVVNGYVSVNLGSVTAFPNNISWDQDMYITMEVGGTSTGTPTWDGEMNPRLKLTAVPYAFQAKSATQLQASDSGNVATLSFTTPTQNNSIVLPNASGTVCLQSSSSCGFAASTGATGYIWNGTAQQTANFNIISANAASVTALIQGASGQTANIFEVRDASGNVNAAFDGSGAQLTLGRASGITGQLVLNNASGAGGITLQGTATAGSYVLNLPAENGTLCSTGSICAGYAAAPVSGSFVELAPSTPQIDSSTNASLAINKTGASGNVLTLQNNGVNIATIGNTGAALFQNSTNSTAAFQIQNAAGQSIINVDTSTTPNLITNGSFEPGTSGWVSKGGSSIAQNGSNSYVGSSSLAVTTSAANHGASYAVTLSPNTTYALSFWARQATGSATAVSIGRQDNGADIDCAAQLIDVQWRLFSCSFTTGASIASSNIYIKQTDTVARTIFVDGVQIQLGSTATQYQDGLIQLNGIINSPLIVRPAQVSTKIVDIQNGAGTSLLNVDGAAGAVGVGGTLLLQASTSSGRIAKSITSSSSLNANDVIVMDSSGRVTTTTTARDPRIFGVTQYSATSNSGVYASILGAATVNATTNSGANPINIGDQLVTSTLAGYVMVDNNATSGILGYATSALASGNGTVTVYIRPVGGQSTPVFRNTTNSTTAFQIQNAAGNSNLFVADTVNNKIGVGVAPNSSLSWTLQANSGGIYSAGQVFAESGVYSNSAFILNGTQTDSGFIMKRTIAGGTVNANDVVVMDSGAQTVATTTARDTRVYGVAGSAATVGNQVPVAIAGNTTVNADASYGAIVIGDQLVTSPTSGRVMKDNNATTGILGFATSALASGTGTVGVRLQVTTGQSTPVFRNATDSTTAFQIQNAAGTALFNANTTSGQIDVTGTLNVTGTLGSISTSSGGNNLSFSRNGINYVTATNSSGSLYLGAGGNSGTLRIAPNGSIIAQNATDSTTAFQIQNAAGTNLFTVDTTNGAVGIKATPSSNYALTVGGNLNVSGEVYGTGFLIGNGGISDGTIRKNAFVATGASVSTGDVVIALGDSGTNIATTTTERDARVFGVATASGAAGTQIQVAIGGTRNVNVDEAAVALGDQLVTSATAGRATVNNNATTGIIGYAMSTKSAGSVGTVSVLIRPTAGQYSPIFRNASDSTTAFQIQNAAGSSLFTVDTTNQRLAVGPAAVPANGVLTVGTNTTTASGGLYFGTDTNLYRSAPFTLKTDNVFVGNSGVFVNNTGGNAIAGLSSTGVLEFGTGSAARDTNLYRYTANSLQTDGGLRVGTTLRVQNGVGFGGDNQSGNQLTVFSTAAANRGIVIRGAASQTGDLLQLQNSGANLLTAFDSSGRLQFADGAGGAYDANLYRSAAGVLKTDGKLSVGTPTTASGAQLVVTTGATNTTGLVVQAVSGQTTDIAQFQSYSGQVRTWVDANGNLNTQGLLINNASWNAIPGLRVHNALASTVGSYIRGASSQTADLFQLQDSSGEVHGAFNSDGSQLSLGRAATTGAVSQGKLVLSDGTSSGYQLTLQAGTLDQSQTIVIPTTVGASDQVCLQSLANCTGTGGGIAGSGTQNYLAKFDTVGGNHVGNSIVYDNGSSVSINTNSATAFKVEQTGVRNNTLVVDTANGLVGIGQAPSTASSAVLQVTGPIAATGSIDSSVQLRVSNASASAGVISKTASAGTTGVLINDVVVMVNEGGAYKVITSATARDARVYGVSASTGASGSSPTIAIGGNYLVNADTAAVSIGDQLVTSAYTDVSHPDGGYVTVDNNATTGIVGYATTAKAAGAVGTVGLRIQVTTGQYSPTFRNATDNTTAFRVQNAAGTSLLSVDTLNSNVVANGVCVASWGGVGIGTGCSNAAKLSVTTAAIGAQINVAGSTQDILQLQDEGINVFTVGDGGATLLKNSADSTTALRVQNAAGTNLLIVDTTNQRLAVGPAAVPANGVLTVGTNTTTASGGIYFGTDSTIYRNGTSSLRTSGSLSVDGNLVLVSCDTVTAKFCVNTSGLGANINVSGANDILNLRTGSTLVTQVTSTGSTLFRNASNSSSGFAVQNASSAQLLNINTTNGTTSISGARSAEVGSWTTGPNLPAVREEHTGVYSNGYLYVLGGSGSYPAASPMNSVAYSALSSTNGSMGSWASTTNLPAALFEGAAASHNGYIYHTGGQDGTTTQATVYYAKQNANGTLGAWATANALPAARREHTATVVNGYLYVVGGYSASAVVQSTVYYAKINSDGTLGSWSTATALPAARNYHSAATANGYLYILGGQNGSNAATVYYAKPDTTTGAISAWTTSANPLPVAYRLGWATTINNYLYYIGGYDGAGSALIRYSPLNALTGANGSWTTNATNRPTTNWFNNIIGANGYLYETGGGFAINTTRYAALTSLTSNNAIEIQTNGGNVATVNGSGHVVIQNSMDATNSFQIQNASGQSLFVADTFNQRLAVGPGAVPATSVLTVGSNTSSADGGITFGTDTSLYRFGANVLGTDSRLLINAATGGAFGLSVRTAGDSNDRLQILGNGTLQFGSGSGLADTNLYRSAADTLKTDDNFNIQTTSNSSTAFRVQNAAGTTALSVDTAALTTSVHAQYDAVDTGANLVTVTDFTNLAWTGTGWTVDATTATHNTGNTSALSTNQVTPVNGTTYQISYTISGSPASNSTLTTSFGGVTFATHTFATTASSTGFTETRVVTATSGSGNLTFTPSSTFNGVISAVEVKVVNQQPSAALVVKNASGVANLEVRTSSSVTNTLIGLNSGSSISSGIQNTAVGSSALQQNTTGSDNAALGYLALQANSTGNSNTAVGSRTLQVNTVGRGNTGVGNLALGGNITGNYNTALGLSALAANVSGSFNTAVGHSTLQATTNSINNVAIGSNALGSLSTGGNNTALGVNTLTGLTLGSSNIAIGFNSGSNVGSGNQLSTGSYNTFMGYYSGLANATQVSRSAAIGSHAQVGSSDSIILGCLNGINSCTATTKVGIGTQYAPNALTVSPGTYSTGTISQSGTAITGSGTTFTAAMTGATIYYNDGTSATITAYNSDTSLTASLSKTVSAGSSYAIVYGGFNVMATGAAYLQPTTDTTNAFRVLAANSNPILTVDSLNQTVGLGAAASSEAKLYVTTGLIGLRVNQIGSSNLLELQANGTNVTTVDATGATLFRNNSNSTTAFQIQNSAGTSNLFVADTTNSRIGIGKVPTQGALDVTGSIYASQSLFATGVIQNSNVSLSAGTFNKAYNSTGTVAVGDAVIFDGDGLISRTSVARDPRVAGVTTYSASNVVNVSVAGNALVNVDTGAVAIGDQLVISATPGLATVDNNATTGIVGFATSAKTAGSNGTVGITVRTVNGQNTPRFQNTADSTTAFQIQNAAGTSNLFNADTTNTRIGIGTAAPNYTLDVNGDVNTTGVFRINGVQISSGTLSDTSNLAKLDANQTFTGYNIFRNTADSTNAFRVQNAAGTNIFNVNTEDGGISFGVNSSSISSFNGFLQGGSAGIGNSYMQSNYHQRLATTASAVNTNEVLVYDNDGNVTQTATARDTRIAGVTKVSAASGATTQLVDSGRTSVLVDTVAVNVGDQLVTSTTSGYATVDNAATTGILGTALTAKAGGSSGTVTVMVRLVSGQYSPTFRNAVDGTTAFQIQNSAGTSNLFVADTTNSRIGVGKVPAQGALDVNGSIFASGSLVADGIGSCNLSYKLCVQTAGAGAKINVTASNNILELENNGTDVVSVGYTGNTIFRNSANSTSAFQVQNAAGTSIFNVDTTGGGFTAGTVGVVSNINGTLNVSNGLSTSYVRAGSVYEVSRTTSSDITSADVLIYDSSGTVTQTTTPRDPRVMGVARSSVSTGQSVAVAISGEANVKVDTGAVNVGDQLVTSSTVNRATVDNNATTGIIGIALASKAAGSNGTINALIRPVGGQYSPLFRNAVDSTAAFRIQNAAGSELFKVDTTNSAVVLGNAGVVGVGNSASDAKLNVNTASFVGLRVNQTGSSDIAQLQSNGTNVLTVTSSGATTFRNVSNSTSAFQIQNAAGTNLFAIDSTNGRAAVGTSAVPANAALTIGTNTTTADGGMYFGTDTSLYRAGTGVLRTGGSFASSSVMWANYLTANQVALGYINGSTNGPGITFSSAMDTNLYRSAAGVIKTDGSFQVAGTGTSYVMGPLGLGTTNPQAASAMTIANGSWITAVDSTGSGYVNMFKVNANNEIQVGAAMNVDGGIVLPTNGGQLTLVDMPIDATASSGTAQSYSFRVGSTNALTVYGQADGAGNSQNLRVAVGSSISPQYTLDVGGDINTSTMYRVAGVQIASTNLSDGSNLAKLNGTQTFTGANTLQNTSTTAFRIQNTGGSTTLFVADTTNSRIAVGPAAVAANAVLTVGTNTTTAAGGIYFGTDTALYRSAANTLTTPGALTVVGALQADSLTLTGSCCGTGINFNNENMVGLNTIQISDSGAGEGFSWADATWSIDNSDLARSNNPGNLNLYGTTGNVAIWRPALFVQNATSYATATAGANGSLAFTSSGTGGVSFRNGSDSSAALQIQNAAGTGLFTADSTNLLIKIGTGTPTLPSTGLGDLFVTGSLEVLGAVLIGTSSNGAMFDGTTHELTFSGTARHARTVTLAPSYTGSAIRGDGSNNTGTMSTSFCSGSSKLNIPSSGNPCGANDQRTYYEWAADATNDNDIWVTYKLPTDFSAFNTNAFTFHGWGTSSNETAILTVYNGSTSCGTFTLTGDGTWQSNNITASTINTNCAGLAAGDVLTINVKLTVGTNGNFARAGEILVNYLSRY